MAALTNIRVLDFSRLLPAPLGTRLLSEHGAEVIKLEIPHKLDPIYTQPPFGSDGRATLYTLLNAGKTIENLDYTAYLTDTAVQTRLDVLLASADVLVEQYRPGVMSVWGLGYEQLRARFPRLIYVSVTGYGQQGALAQAAGHDLNYLAHSGLLHLNRDDQGKPVIPNFQIADVAGGSFQVLSEVALALLERQQTGAGKWIDISMTHSLEPLRSIARSQQQGGWDPLELRMLGGGLVNYNVYADKEGNWLALGALELKFWDRFCEWADRPDWRRGHVLELACAVFPKQEVEAFFATKTSDEWVESAKNADFCLAAVKPNW